MITTFFLIIPFNQIDNHFPLPDLSFHILWVRLVLNFSLLNIPFHFSLYVLILSFRNLGRLYICLICYSEL